MLELPYETARLRFELPDLTSETDLANHLAFISEERVARMLARVPHPYPTEELPKRYEQWHQAYTSRGTNLTFIVRLKINGKLIGSCGISLEGNRTALEAGYVFAPEVWGQGYATETLISLISHGLKAYPTVRRVECPHFADNPASGRVMEKAGLVFSHREMHECVARGPGTYPAKVFRLPSDSPLWPENR